MCVLGKQVGRCLGREQAGSGGRRGNLEGREEHQDPGGAALGALRREVRGSRCLALLIINLLVSLPAQVFTASCCF